MSSVSEDDVFSSGNGDSVVVVEDIDSQLYPNHLLPDMFLPQTDLYLECSEENSLDGLSSPLDSTSSAGQNVSQRISSSSDRSFAVRDGVVSGNNSEITSNTSGFNWESLPEQSQSAVAHSTCTTGASLTTLQGVLSHSGQVLQSMNDVLVSAAPDGKTVLVERTRWKTTFVCSVCQKVWPTAHKLARHSLSHNAYLFSCQEPGCSKTFKHRPALLDHNRVVHRKGQSTPGSAGADRSSRARSASQAQFQCPWPGCGKSFRDGHNLRVHHCLHTGDTLLSCSLCSYRCVQKASLNWHVKKMHS